jgi:AraC-like DNA-binding protein
MHGQSMQYAARGMDADRRRRLERSRELLVTELGRAVPLDEAAREACMSKYHFLRRFQQTFGETPHDFLVRMRMEEARRLLGRDTMSVTEICMEVGYESLGSFSVRFRSLTGCSPSEYRSLTRKQFVHPGLPITCWLPSCLLFM